MLKRIVAILACASCAVAATAAALGTIAAFSAAAPGARLPPGWTVLTLPGVKPADFALVRDAGVTVLHVHSDAATGSAGYRLKVQPREAGALHWRWKIERTLAAARFGTKEGDDFAARVYVSFDVPMESLTFMQRAKLRLARLIHGADLPAAAICYVWDNRVAVGTTAWNPYSDRVRMVVVESGDARAGEWVAEIRDVEADYRAAFGASAAVVSGVAVSADTDQTGENVNAWFGDLRFEGRK